MYIIFTSGSTGAPKGVMISHETYTSSAFPRAKAVGYTEISRVLDFASYAFDVSIDSMLLTLAKGGCLCIPSDDDRMNDINGAMRRMKVNYAGLTPSVARILDPDIISSLDSLGLGGEAVTARDVTRWGRHTRIVIGYGPSECTIGCTINGSAATGRDYISIGTGNGAAIWITDPNNHESLMPVGAVGELLVEGPIVGQGYLNDPVKTAAGFITDPSWLVAGHKSHPGRRGRLYKTGDLGKYDPDGCGGIVFVGRKDTQVKLRGQRVELGEVEFQLAAVLPLNTNVTAEVIVPSGIGGQSTLVAFIAPQTMKSHDAPELALMRPDSELKEALSGAAPALSKILPRYMVPTAYIPLNHLPMLISGKVDRKQLRNFGASIDLRELDEDTQNGTPFKQLNDIEQRMRQVWAEVLKLESETIRADDNFFVVGGDSLASMKLAAVCRTQGLDVTVASAFRHPTLSAMAKAAKIIDYQEKMTIPPFSMLVSPIENACFEAAQACGSDTAAIEDIYPCTPTQESLFTFSIKSDTAYVAQRVALIPPHISIDQWKKAWNDVVKACPILRTRLVQLSEPGLHQVVLRENICWRHSTSLTQYLETDKNERMEVGQSLSRFCVVENACDSKRYMVWTIHHVLYDGWSEPFILKKVAAAVQDLPIETQAQMRDFVKYVRDTDERAMHDFWRQELNGAVGSQFPNLPSRDYLPHADVVLEHYLHLNTADASPFTVATLIRGAWALVASQYTGNDDVVFGETLTGRDIPLDGVEGIEGPLIATLPVRVQVDRTNSIQSFLQNIQEGMLSRTPFQHYGMQNIRRVSPDAMHACEARTGLVIQPEMDYVGRDLGFDQGDVVREALHFNPYPLMLACGVQKMGLRLCASFDSNLITAAHMERILAQLETAYMQLTNDPSRRVGDISCLSEAELNQVWQWNQVAPLSFNQTTKSFRAGASVEVGSQYPRAVVPWVCNPRNGSLLSPIGSPGELWLEGALPMCDSAESPTWLAAGSPAFPGRTGTVQPTGDIVQLSEDGTLMFVGRKENILPLHGHLVDVTALETHFTRHLPSSTHVATAVYQATSDGTNQNLQQELILFIEQQASKGDMVNLLPAVHNITCNALQPHGLDLIICAEMSQGLAQSLRSLDKSIQDSLPPSMVPFAYVVVEKLPAGAERLEQEILNQLASSVPQPLLCQLRDSLKSEWDRSLALKTLTPKEHTLQCAWATILRINPEQIDIDDNFFRLGGDSVLAMRLVSNLRTQGYTLTVADIFQNMRLGDAARVMAQEPKIDQLVLPYKPFSTLGDVDAPTFVSEILMPQLADSNWSIQDAAPVTDSQVLDLRATVHAPRTSIQYTILYFDSGVNRETLFRACQELVDTHEILRTVFIEHESTFFQVVLQSVVVDIATKQADEKLEKYVTDLCMTDAASAFNLGSPFFRFFYVKDKDDSACLVMCLSHSLYDGTSLPQLLQDLETLYVGAQAVDPHPFMSYMSYIGQETKQSKAKQYWSGLLNGSKLSALNVAPVQVTDASIFLTKIVDISQRPDDITTASLLVAAWALVLARRLKTSDVTFGTITSGRTGNMANEEKIAGPCYQFMPVRITFDAQWTARDLLDFTQKQIAQSSPYDFLGFEKISKQCTSWSAESRFFDSVVHHQDFDDFDTMPFAGGSCRVEILNPHGDAANPIKAVSLLRDGQSHVGVVGSKRDSELLGMVLDELVAAAQELALSTSERVLHDVW